MSLGLVPVSWWAALAAALAVAAPVSAGAEPAPRTVPLEALRARLGALLPMALTARGLEIHVDRYAYVPLPFAAQELELDAEADGPVLLTWAARSASGVKLYGPPWRYTVVPHAPATLRLDLRITRGWNPSVQSVLFLKGGGTVIVHAMRARPVAPDLGAALASYDRALLWAPESIGHTTINFLTPSYWSASGGTWLSDVVAAGALAVFVGTLAAIGLRRRRWAPGLAVAMAALFAVGAWNAHFLVRFLPAAKLSFDPDPEARIRDNYYFDPEFGALAALARATLRPDERVGAMAAPGDWFAPQTLCFDLAPRRCVVVKPGEQEHVGISGLGRLRSDEIDAIVAFGKTGPLPDGFVPVAAVSPDAVVARRR